MSDIQLHNNKLKHLIALKNLSKSHIMHILDTASNLLNDGKLLKSKALDDMSVANLFFEPSTRTRNTFEIAAKRSSAKVINVDIANSATKKNESLLDTMQTLEAMQIDMFVLRHSGNEIAEFIAQNIHNASIINAGGGTNEHPTQGLLDCLTISQHKKSFADLTITIVGDIKNSRVAHSDIYGLTTLGVRNIRLVSPHNLTYQCENCINYTDINAALTDSDVVMTLRLQKERMLEAQIPDEEEYFKQYGITTERMQFAKPDAIVMHPGPINRGVEILSEIADSPQSVILQQVTNGIAVRMAVMQILAENNTE
jgi:aspartate carbamoyltransferase catalytic subunit